jgi:NMT1/THI5 like
MIIQLSVERNALLSTPQEICRFFAIEWLFPLTPFDSQHRPSVYLVDMYHNFLTVVTLLCACATVSFAQDAKKPISVIQAISTPDFGYLPSLIARSTGYFAQEGLDFKLLVISVRVSVPALLSRQVQFAPAGSSMPAALQGAPLKAIFFSYRTSTFQLIVRPEITSPQALKGKAIGISSPGSSNDQASRLMMRKLGLEPNRDVTLFIHRRFASTHPRAGNRHRRGFVGESRRGGAYGAAGISHLDELSGGLPCAVFWHGCARRADQGESGFDQTLAARSYPRHGSDPKES